MKTLLGLFAAAFFLTPTFSFACSCAGWSSAQQGAQKSGALVAIVETKADLGGGLATVQIKQSLKGNQPTGEISVLGQDGLNCNGELILDKGVPWVLLFQKVDGKYYSLACGEAALPITAENKVQLTLGEKTEISLNDFRDLVSYRKVPTVKGLSCAFAANRTYVNLDSPEDPAWSFSFYETAASDASMNVDFERDLGGRGPRIGMFKGSASAHMIRPDEFGISVSMTDPFFTSTAHTSGTIDLRRSYTSSPLSITRYTKLDGSDYVIDNPFLAHTTSADCSVHVGLPLIPVNLN